MRAWRRVRRWEYFGLALIVVAGLAMHFSIINDPQDVMTR